MGENISFTGTHRSKLFLCKLLLLKAEKVIFPWPKSIFCNEFPTHFGVMVLRSHLHKMPWCSEAMSGRSKVRSSSEVENGRLKRRGRKDFYHMRTRGGGISAHAAIDKGMLIFRIERVRFCCAIFSVLCVEE